jgi:imidazolonepropionase-like amidohydrolase
MDFARFDQLQRILQNAWPDRLPCSCDSLYHQFAQLKTTSPTYVTAHAMQILGKMLYRGFTTVRDAIGADHGLARTMAGGHIVRPRLLFCGKALSQTGGLGILSILFPLNVSVVPTSDGSVMATSKSAR